VEAIPTLVCWIAIKLNVIPKYGPKIAPIVGAKIAFGIPRYEE